MRRALSPALIALLGAALCACASAPGEARPPAGRELFDGHSLAGWEGDARYWRVEAGALVGESTPAEPCSETNYLVWRGGEVGDFELELEWRFPDGGPANSGVQFRSLAPSPARVSGYQADLESGPDWTGGLYEQDGRGVVARRGERVVLGTDGAPTVERFADGGALLARVEPTAWNHLRVAAFGPRLTIEVNGTLFSETIDLDPARAARRGALALQLHAGAPMRVEYRGLVLRELAAPRPAVWAGASTLPQWIWPTAAAFDGQGAWFRRRFELAGAPVHAELWIAADDHFDAWLGGQGVATGDDWAHPLRVDVTAWLEAGENELLVRAENEGGPAGLVLELTAEFADGTRVRLVSDAAFEACAPQPASVAEAELGAWLDQSAPWQGATVLGALGTGPWGQLGAELTLAGEAPAAETIHVPPGFTVERLYSVPLATQGSWVALALDPRGRFYVSDQYGGLFRVALVDGGVRVTPVPVELGEAHGLLWAFDALYAVVSDAGEYPSGLYRARDTDGDDELDTVELLRAFEGDGEHGPHGLVLHPDGRSLVITGGNHTALPEPFVSMRLPATWAEDVLLAPLPDPGGHALGIHAPGGWVVRTDPEGRRWELVAAGLRNAYDLAYSSAGELFTYDSDMEWDVGLPWYRPTRVLHVVSGADFGWRSGSAKWPADHYDSLPPAVELGLGSPTGLVFGTDTHFPAPWKQALFACDWAYGRIHAVFLEPVGASYRGRHEVFASGEPFAVTDVLAGPDGALYATVGGRRTQSGLYRIAWAGSAADEAEPIADAGADARARRRALERFHGAGAPFGEEPQALAPAEIVTKALAELGDPDRFVRTAARLALEHQDPALWAEAVRAETGLGEPGLGERLGEPGPGEAASRRALEGWLALVRSAPATPAHEVIERALALFEAAPEPAERLDALRLIGLALLRLDAGDAERTRVRTALDGAYPGVDARLDRALLELLVYVGADVSERALAALDGLSTERGGTQEQRIAILYALRALDTGWNEVRGRRLLEAFERELASASGGASVRGYLEGLRDEARTRVGAGVVASRSGAPAPLTAPASFGWLAGARAPHAWSAPELEPRLGELGAGRDFERGRAAYRAASCQQCHRLAGEGQNLGPDLTGAAGRYSARDLLLATLEPSREVPDVWRDTELWGEHGLLAVGRIESESESELVLRDTAGARVELDAARVSARSPHRLSRMPEGLLDTLTADEILDLLAYVLAGGDAHAARFR